MLQRGQCEVEQIAIFLDPGMKAGSEIPPRFPDQLVEQPVPIRLPEPGREDGAGPDAEQQGAEAR